VYISRHIISLLVFAVKLFILRGLTMFAKLSTANRFVRKTQLGTHEYRKNFHQIDQEVIAAITSPEADEVTPLMSKIYLRIVNAPNKYWERDGTLHFKAEWREGGHVKAWTVLCEAIGVASATASKALSWMHDEGIIGYYSGKNGVGIRIFLNRAASSIGVRQQSGSKKILDFAPASSVESPASQNEAAFNDSYAIRDNSDTDLNPRAPKNGADNITVVKKSSASPPAFSQGLHTSTEQKGREMPPGEDPINGSVSTDEIVRRLRNELKPALHSSAVQAARREHERTREWLDKHGIPKAVRVAQREAYNVLKSCGVINSSAERARASLEVGHDDYTPVGKPLSADEMKELAGVCMAMLDTHGQAIDATLSEISVEAGGNLLAEDAPKVRELAWLMVHELGRKE
jgi:hypothetical protein